MEWLLIFMISIHRVIMFKSPQDEMRLLTYTLEYRQKTDERKEQQYKRFLSKWLYYFKVKYISLLVVKKTCHANLYVDFLFDACVKYIRIIS